MNFFLELFSFDGYLIFPKDLVGWSVLVGLGVLLLVLVWRFQHLTPKGTSRRWLIFVALLVITPFSSIFIGLQLPVENALTLPGTPLLPENPILMLFSALPWILAAGFLGPFPTALLAGLSGGIISYFYGHSPFIPLNYALVGVLFSTTVRQRYRTTIYRVLSRPLAAGLTVSLLYPLLYLLTTVFIVSGSVSVGLDYAFSHLQGISLVFAGQILVGALLAEVIALSWSRAWYGTDQLEPSPAERSLESRLVYRIFPLVLILMIFLMTGDWIVANNTARTMLEDRMRNTASAAADSFPFFLETGQNLILQISENEGFLTSALNEDLVLVLVDNLNKEPFFNQLTILDGNGDSLAGYPESTLQDTFPTPDEMLGIELAQKGVGFQMYSLPPKVNDTAGGLVFIATIQDETGAVQRILLGRTRLSENPFTQPIINNLLSLTDIDGAGMLVDETGLILFHPDFSQVGTYFTEPIGQEEIYNPNATAHDGTRQMMYIKPVSGRSWAVIATVPAEVAQQTALENAVPLIGWLAGMAVVGFLILRMGLRLVTSNLQELAFESGRIAEGDLDHRLEAKGADEVGQLGQSLEQMRVNLKSRIDEINKLLFVSQGVASALEMEVAVKPILKGALASGASSARLVLAQAALPDYDQAVQTQFGLGASTDRFEHLDGQILALVERQSEDLVINPLPALLGSAPGNPVPAALMAVALRHENTLYGTLWTAFDQSHDFTEEEKRFLTAIAGQAALAASNARLYLSAQLGRQRLEAILSSTPDPVLVTDHKDRLLLANPAAVVLLGDENEPINGMALEEIIRQEELLNLLQRREISEEPQSVEVGFPDNRIYYATASPVLADGQVMGRVCVLSDITQFKELDALKSEFVANVSHDLRSPLTLMRGYATMLQMVGELNEVQTGYINKIVTGVENMSLLVNNLLDLGRIEAGIGLQLEMVPMADITRQVTEALHIQAIQKQIDLSLNLPANSMPLVEADQALLYQAIYNLVDNAIKYTEVGGKVNVVVKEEPELAIFEVRDTGIGISPVDLPRLFERFYRAVGRKSRQQRGSGLGLTIVKSIAERHGGGIRVESQLGKGSKFTLSIPLRHQVEPEK